MRIVLISKDESLIQAANEGCAPFEVESFVNWKEALEAAAGADVMFIDMLATLERPHEVAGYEDFAHAKMSHPVARDVSLILISPPADYDLDCFVGWDGFVRANIQRPVSAKVFRRASTWV